METLLPRGARRSLFHNHHNSSHITLGLFFAAVAASLPSCQGGLAPADSGLHDLVFNLPSEVQPLPFAGTPIFGDRPIFEAIPGKVGHHAATIAALPDGSLLAAWYSYDGPGELDGSAIFMARRPAGSDTWATPELHIDRAVGDGNPVLYGEGESLWLFQAVVPFGWSTAHIEMQRSFDAGNTWTPPREIAGPLGSNTRYPPVRLSDGSLLLPAYDDLLARALFFSSADGDSWALRSAVDTPLPHRPIQPSIVELDGGRLLAVMRNTGTGWLWVTASDDGGRMWSRPIDGGFPNPGSPAALLKLAGGNLILVYNDSPTERRPLSIAMSADGGASWPHRRVVAEGSETYSYPSAAQSPDGMIHIVYSLARRRIQHATLNEAWIAGAGP